MITLCETDVLPSCTHSGQPSNEHAVLHAAGPSRCRKLAVPSGLLSWRRGLVIFSHLKALVSIFSFFIVNVK